MSPILSGAWWQRIKRLLDRALQAFELNLTDLVVLTEAASGYFALTPLIAALAGAFRVLAVGRDSEYGSFGAIQNQITRLGNRLGVAPGVVHYVPKPPSSELIRSADIVTNLGFVRPIDRAFIAGMKATAVVSLMWETWEYRPADLDLDACWEANIAVLGTNESDPRLQSFRYVGLLGIKKLLEAGIELLGSKIVLVGGGPFGLALAEAFSQYGAETLIVCDEEGVEGSGFSLRKIGTRLQEAEIKAHLKGTDALILNPYPWGRRLPSDEAEIGPAGTVAWPAVARVCAEALVVEWRGGLDRTPLQRLGLQVIPERPRAPEQMSWSLAELGPKPVIDLHTAGLKVGERLARARRQGLNRVEAEQQALLDPLCQGFGYNRMAGGRAHS